MIKNYKPDDIKWSLWHPAYQPTQIFALLLLNLMQFTALKYVSAVLQRDMRPSF